MCVFFFFKQKTAYEMRISDWSSDVCSSDLIDRITPTHRFGGAETRGRNGGLVEAVLNIHRTRPSPSCSLAENGAHANRSLASQGIQTAVEVREPVADREIGRASCRARVCQYV